MKLTAVSVCFGMSCLAVASAPALAQKPKGLCEQVQAIMDNWYPPDRLQLEASSTYEDAVGCQAFYGASFNDIVKRAATPGLSPEAMKDLKKSGQRDRWFSDAWKKRIDTLVKKSRRDAGPDMQAASATAAADFSVALSGDTVAAQRLKARRKTCNEFEKTTYRSIEITTTVDLSKCLKKKP
jgi:hypothetical protein